MATHINGNSGPLVLTVTAQDPVKIGPNGVINGGPGIAIDGTAVDAWNISNLGAVAANISIRLQAGGNITNGIISNSAASIVGAVTAVEIDGKPGTVANFGTIEATSGIGSLAILMKDGGTIVNHAGALIRGGDEAVLISGAAGKIINSGEIDGIVLNQGGAVSNGTGGLIDGISVLGDAGTVTNAGTITGPRFAAISLFAGGSITNQRSGTIQGSDVGIQIAGASGNVVNLGSVTAPSAGIELSHGGKVQNGSAHNTNAVIKGFDAVQIFGGTGTVNNFGQIYGEPNGFAVTMTGGTIINHAGGVMSGPNQAVSITGQTGVVNNWGEIDGTIFLQAGGQVNNREGGIIDGQFGIVVSGSVGMVSNSGKIKGLGIGLASGISLENGGTVTNAAGGSIEGQVFGVHADASAIVVNAGTIDSLSSSGAGVRLVAGGTLDNRDGALIKGDFGVVLDAGGSLINHGIIEGNQAGILLRATAGATVKDFGTVEGVIGIDVENNMAANVLIIAGSVTGTGGTAVELGTNDALVVTTSAVLNGGIANFQQNDTIDLANVHPNMVTFSNGELHYGANQVALSSPTTNLITFGSDHHGGTLVFLS